MSQSADLLRLLEPAVRPVGGPTAIGKTAAQPGGQGEAPFEKQDFATLLAQSKQELAAAPPATDESNPATKTTAVGGPLNLLADFGRIENPGLRELLAGQPRTNPAP